MKTYLFALTLIPTVLLSPVVLADAADPNSMEHADSGERGASEQRNFSTSGRPTSSYQKERRFLPGENVVTPSGQKMKIWSTVGPVPVSRAPEPFEDPRDRVNPNIGVVIDGRTPNQIGTSSNSNSGAASSGPGNAQRRSAAPTSAGDSFDLNVPGQNSIDQ